MSLVDFSKERDVVYTEYKDYLVTSVVCDYGVFEKYTPYKYDRNPPKPEDLTEIDGKQWKVKLILNSRSNAIEVLRILNKDTVEHRKNNKSLIPPKEEERRYKVEILGRTFDSMLTKSEAYEVLNKLKTTYEDFKDLGSRYGLDHYIKEMPL